MLQSSLRTLTILSSVALIAAIAALVLVSLQFTRTRFRVIETEYIHVRPNNNNTEGIFIDFNNANGEAAYPHNAAGVRVAMPKATASGTSQQAGVAVDGGQVSFLADGPVSQGVLVDTPGPNAYVFSAKHATSDHVLVNNGVSLFHGG